MPWWEQRAHSDRRGRLIARGALIRSVRGYFEGDGFTETACGTLQASPGNELHLHGFATVLDGLGGERHSLYLATSPEFAMKKLLAAGEERIFELARVFRNREAGPLHASEFTMLEWYRAGRSYEAVIKDALAMMRLAGESNDGKLAHRECEVSADATERVSVAEAFERHAGIDLLASVARSGETDHGRLAADARRAGVRVAADDSWSDIFSRVMASLIEPQLGRERVTVLEAYPAPEAALASLNPKDPRVAQRFEIFACGLELANGFAELTDAAEQRRRFEMAMNEKERRFGTRYPLDEEFLAALDHMPDAAGVAMGFDRLAMLATGAPRIDDVMWTPPWRLEER
jgi:lysyl-tRNA synthetase class 2